MSEHDDQMAKETPILSVICAGKRPSGWGRLCDSLKVQTIPFEVVTVGPYPPESWVPPWFHYWYSQVKPHQAQVAAAVLARGRLLCYFNDDWILQKPDTLGAIVREWDQCGTAHAIVAPHMSGSYPYFSFASDRQGPLLPFGDVFDRETFLARGGWDRRFIGIYASNDYAIEQQAKKYPVKILWPWLLDEICTGSLWNDLWEHDRSFLDYLWMDGYEPIRPRERTFDRPLRPIRATRRLPVWGYDVSAPDLLYHHQGCHGKWQDLCEDCWRTHCPACPHVPVLPPEEDLSLLVREWERELLSTSLA